MLTSTFIHAQGIGYTTERKIWDAGALTWEHFIEQHPELRLSPAKKALLLPRVEESIVRLQEGDHAYFSEALPNRDHWRALSEFGDSIAYLDIETTGCNPNWGDCITVIGLYTPRDPETERPSPPTPLPQTGEGGSLPSPVCGRGVGGEGRSVLGAQSLSLLGRGEMKTFIQGINMDEFPAEIARYKMLVTFFGSGFDIPFIQRTFPDLRIDQLHVDLCHLLRRIGLTGGLKSIETKLGIRRIPECEGLSGFDAVRLWNEYRRGSQEALELLLLYNKEDVMNMEALLRHGCSELLKGLDHPLYPDHGRRPL